MSRKLHMLDEQSTYKPSFGWHGFDLIDDQHRTFNSFLPNADLRLGVLASVSKDTMEPWLEVTLVETTYDKNGRARPEQIGVLLKREEMIALRDTINAVLGATK